MKIYQKELIGIDLPWDKIGMGIGIIILLFAGWILFNSSTGNVVYATLGKNPISLIKDDATILHVKLTNPTNESVSNIVVLTETTGTNQLSVFPQQKTISQLGPQESREMEFNVVPLDPENNPFLPGTYRIDVRTTLNNTIYQTSVFLNVEK
ncbi:MAG: hypothetical protein V1776_04895 [Candidatus Diapherotrites archaeon]